MAKKIQISIPDKFFRPEIEQFVVRMGFELSATGCGSTEYDMVHNLKAVKARLVNRFGEDIFSKLSVEAI
jgi:hypothetical protein